MEQQYIGCDAHRRYSVFVVMDDKGQASKPVRVEHDRSELREYLRRLQLASVIALVAVTTGSGILCAATIPALVNFDPPGFATGPSIYVAVPGPQTIVTPPRQLFREV